MRPANLRSDYRIACLLLVVLGITSQVLAEQSSGNHGVGPVLEREIDSAVRENLARTGVPSVSIALVRDKQVVYSHTYGDATLEPRRPAQQSMRYPIGSISKEFTAAALLLLQEDGRLSLDDPAGKYLDHLGPAATVTIRQLLSHTSGVRDFWPQDFLLPDMLKPVLGQEIISRWGAKPLDFAPGTAWQYSNTGYTIAGLIAEKVGGRPLPEQLSERIFRPLGMTSVVDVNVGTLSASDPTGYLRYALGPLRPSTKEAPGWLFAAGSLAMTASDLARWDIALMQHGVLKEKSLREISREVVLENGAGTGYALGLDVGFKLGRRFLGHGGEIDGFTAHHLVFPEDGIAVVVLTNQEATDASETIANELAEILLMRATAAEAALGDRDRAVFTALQHGTLDSKLLTANARSYFTPQAREDYQRSLGPLGDPSAFELKRSSLRGGLATRVYEVTCSGRKLQVVIRATPGGLLEQYTVSAK
jgi:D-alanyl-D-alanine carboxypeptidase